MAEIRIIDASEIVKPSTRPNNLRLTYYKLYGTTDVHYSPYGTNRSRPSPAEIGKLESKLVMEEFDNL
ncbi:hypothetical protein HN865_00300 [Candidatus Woesearchaeota archaeon]|jgi:hypothetical protein|nr:hypothetical protein [Candidatus Woesearchaeota archaeon]MBT7237282.1 hypothetical protein [Candidatus Woesearchaeota archaeon]